MFLPVCVCTTNVQCIYLTANRLITSSVHAVVNIRNKDIILEKVVVLVCLSERVGKIEGKTG